MHHCIGFCCNKHTIAAAHRPAQSGCYSRARRPRSIQSGQSGILNASGSVFAHSPYIRHILLAAVFADSERSYLSLRSDRAAVFRMNKGRIRTLHAHRRAAVASRCGQRMRRTGFRKTCDTIAFAVRKCSLPVISFERVPTKCGGIGKIVIASGNFHFN